jgi:hypothetical protein
MEAAAQPTSLRREGRRKNRPHRDRNWSARANFSKYGDMKKATAGFDPQAIQHPDVARPFHWHAEVTEKYQFVDLTLSGHTHGFQYGIEIPGFKWSPVQYLYKEWADLYTQGGRIFM